MAVALLFIDVTREPEKANGWLTVPWSVDFTVSNDTLFYYTFERARFSYCLPIDVSRYERLRYAICS